MRILIVGSTSNYAIERYYQKYLAENNLVTKVDLFAAQDIFLKYYKKGIHAKVIFRLGLSSILKKINALLIQKVETAKPSVVLVFKGMEIWPDTLAHIKSLKIKLVNYNPDNPFLFSGRGSGNKNISQSLNLYDLHFTYNQEVKARIETEYGIPTRLLPFGYELSDHQYENCVSEKEIIKTCFVGNPDRFRAKAISYLADRGMAIDLFGNNWPKFINHRLVNSYGPVYHDEFWRVIRKYRVQLNLMRPHNPSSHNMRTFEIPAVGGIQLAPNSIDHRTYFERVAEINLYDDYEDCLTQIESILSWPKSRADAMRSLARLRSVTSGYSYKHRADEVVAELNTLLI